MTRPSNIRGIGSDVRAMPFRRGGRLGPPGYRGAWGCHPESWDRRVPRLGSLPQGTRTGLPRPFPPHPPSPSLPWFTVQAHDGSLSHEIPGRRERAPDPKPPLKSYHSSSLEALSGWISRVRSCVTMRSCTRFGARAPAWRSSSQSAVGCSRGLDPSLEEELGLRLYHCTSMQFKRPENARQLLVFL
jgi:hypothetical protein